MSPYIQPDRREPLRAQCGGSHPCNAGELNFVLTDLCLRYLNIKTKQDYAAYNEVIGVLECMKQELYRKRVAAYEDKKEQENGPIF